MTKIIKLVAIISILSGCVVTHKIDNNCNNCRHIIAKIRPFIDSLYEEKAKTIKWEVVTCTKGHFDTTYQIKTRIKGKGDFLGITVSLDTNCTVLNVVTTLSGFD